MEIIELNKYPLVLLATLILVILVHLINGFPAVNFEMHDKNFVLPAFKFLLFFIALLGMKAFMYYNNELQLYAYLCWVDVLLTAALCFFMIYRASDGLVGNDLSQNGVIIFTLTIAAWVLIQFFVFANYMVVMFFAER